jgi:hypothetical protein
VYSLENPLVWDEDEQALIEKKWSEEAKSLQAASTGTLKKLRGKAAVLAWHEERINARINGLISASATHVSIGPWLRLLDESDMRQESLLKIDKLIRAEVTRRDKEQKH